MLEERFEAAESGAIEAGASALSRGSNAVLQFYAPPYPDDLLIEINRLCAVHGERLQVRFYGHYQDAFDFEVLATVPKVVNLATDCLQRAVNVQALGQLRSLRRLSFDFFDYSDRNFLDLRDPS